MYSKSATTIASILDSAQRLFLDKNYADVTMDEIADAAGVTKGALYHHFPGKESLYIAMMHADLEEKQALLKAAAGSGGACRERLRKLIAAFLALPPQKRESIKLVRRDINIFRNPARNRLVRAYQAALPEQIEEIIRDGIRDGELASADARLLAWMHVAMVEVILTDYAAKVIGSDAERADFVVDLFFGGAGKNTS